MAAKPVVFLTMAAALYAAAAPVITVDPGRIVFRYRPETGSSPAQRCVGIFTPAGSAGVKATLNTGGLGWVFLIYSSFRTPASLCVQPKPENLQSGTYRGELTLTTTDGPPATVAIPIVMIVETLPPPKLVVSPLEIPIAVGKNALPQRRGLTFANVGGGTVSFSVYPTNLGWLRADSFSGSLAAGKAMAMPMVVDPTGLDAGVYRAQIAVQSDSGNQTAVVSLHVSEKGSIVATERGLEFLAYAGGPSPEQQSPAISNAGPGTAALRIDAPVASGGNWLRVAPAPPEAVRGETALPVAVNSQGLAPGRYAGQVVVNSGTTSNSPQFVGVGLNVLAGAPLGPGAPPPFGFSFTAVDAERTGTLNGAADRSMDYNVVTGTENGGLWLLAQPQSGTIPAGGTVQLAVRGSVSDLPVGGYRGSVQVGLSDGTVRTAPMVLTSGGKGPACAADDPAGVGFLSPAEGFQATVGQALALRVAVSGCNGALLNDGEAAVQAGGRMITLTRESTGVWAGTWTPILVEDLATLTAFGTQTTNGSRAAAMAAVNGQVVAAPVGSAPAVAGTVNGASFDTAASVAPLTWISIYGEGLSAEAALANSTPFPLELGGAEVRVGDVALPLYYASPKQINAVMPRGLGTNTLQALVVRRRGGASVPVQISVGDAAPGIFTQNQAGTGQASALIAGTSTVAAPGTPVRRGDFVELYCTGLGPVTNPPADGAPASSNPVSQAVLPIKLFLAGRELPVSFAGLTPGNVGLYQVNFRVPTDGPPGDAVQVVLNVKGLPSNPATIAIQ